MVIKTTYHFVYSNLNVEISQKEGLTEKEKKFWKLLFLGEGRMTYFGERKVFGGLEVRGNYAD